MRMTMAAIDGARSTASPLAIVMGWLANSQTAGNQAAHQLAGPDRNCSEFYQSRIEVLRDVVVIGVEGAGRQVRTACEGVEFLVGLV